MEKKIFRSKFNISSEVSQLAINTIYRQERVMQEIIKQLETPSLDGVRNGG